MKLKSKSIIFVVLLSILTSSIAVFGYAQFSDVKSGAYYEDAVYTMSSLGVIKGYDNGQFGPDDFVTRGQVATMLNRYHNNVVSPIYDYAARQKAEYIGDLYGDNWQTYQEEYSKYPLALNLGGEGSYGYDYNQDYFNEIPDGFKIGYDNTVSFGGEASFGERILVPQGYESGDTWFYIWINTEIGWGGVFGFFYDDASRLINEANLSAVE